MNNQTNGYFMELDLKDVFWELLSQWKAILIVSLIFAMIVCGAKHKKSVDSYNAAVKSQNEAAEQAKLSVDERIAAVLDKLSEDDRSIVEYIFTEEKWTTEQKNYLKNSLIMNVDPTNERVLRMVFDIRPGEYDNISTLMQSYYTFLRSPEMLKPLKGCMAPESDEKYIAEMIFLDVTAANLREKGDSAALCIKIVLTDEADADAVANAAVSTISEYSEELRVKFDHSISFVESEESLEYDTDLVNRRINLFGNTNSVTNNLNTMKAALTSDQQKALDAIAQINEESEKGTPEPEKLHVPKYSKKYALLGFILGAIAYAFAYVVVMIVRNRVNNAADAGRYTGTRVLGELYVERDAKGLKKLFHSNAVEKLQHKGKLDTAVQTEKIVSAVKAACSHADTKEIVLLDFAGGKDSAGKLIEGLKTALDADGIKVDTVDACGNTDEMVLSKIRNALFAITEDVKVTHLAGMLELCKDYDIDGIGSIWLGEV